MVQYVLTGTGASKYVGLGNNRVKVLRRQSAKYLNSFVGVKRGYVLAQKKDKTERVIIQVKDPYVVTYVRIRNILNAETTKIVYIPFFGGLTGEEFYGDLPFNFDPDSFLLNQTILHYAGNGSVISLRSTQTVVAASTVTSGPYHKFSPATMDARFCIMNFVLGIHHILTTYAQVVVNIGAQLEIQFEPIGESLPGVPWTYAKMSVVPVPAEEYDIILAFNKVEKLGIPDIIWPPAGLNGGRTDLVAIVSMISVVGRGNCIFIIEVFNDWTTGNSDTTAAHLVHLSDFGASYTLTNLATIDPSIGLTFNGFSDFAYSGDGFVSMIIVRGPTDYLLYLSNNLGVSWVPVTWPAGVNEIVQNGFDRHGLYSMYHGHVEFVTSNAISGILHRYVSTDHGTTWSGSVLNTGDAYLRDRAVAISTTFDGNNVPLSYATAGELPAVGNIPSIVQLNRFSGVSPLAADALPPVIVVSNVDYNNVPGDGDSGVQYVPGLFAKLPYPCFFGNNVYKAPLLPGYPRELENS